MKRNTSPMARVMARYGLKPGALAAAAGVSTESVRQWRLGQNRPTPERARLIERKLGIPRHEIRPDLWDAPRPAEPVARSRARRSSPKQRRSDGRDPSPNNEVPANTLL